MSDNGKQSPKEEYGILPDLASEDDLSASLLSDTAIDTADIEDAEEHKTDGESIFKTLLPTFKVKFQSVYQPHLDAILKKIKVSPSQPKEDNNEAKEEENDEYTILDEDDQHTRLLKQKRKLLAERRKQLEAKKKALMNQIHGVVDKPKETPNQKKDPNNGLPEEQIKDLSADFFSVEKLASLFKDIVDSVLAESDKVNHLKFGKLLKQSKAFKHKEAKLLALQKKIDSERAGLKEIKDQLGKSGDKEADIMAQEFLELNKKYVYNVNKKLFSIGKDKTNMYKNRYSNILPFNETLIQLSSGRYINANNLSLYGSKYIATQWPLNKGLLNTEEEFWEMTFDQKVNIIIALQNPSPPKHMYYWPKEKGSKKDYQNYQIKHIITLLNKNFNVIKIQITKLKTKEKRSVHILLYYKWPDHGLPDDQHSLYTLQKTAHALNGGILKNTSTPVLVHCSAGIGRTGVYVACDLLVRNNWNRNMIREVVAKMRKQRYGMIQNFKQYKYVYDFIDKFVVDEDL